MNFFRRLWAAYCLKNARYHQDAAWDPGADCIADRGHDVGRCWICDTITAGHIQARNRWYARYDRAATTENAAAPPPTAQIPSSSGAAS